MKQNRKLRYIIFGIFDKQQHNRQYVRLIWNHLPGRSLQFWIWPDKAAKVGHLYVIKYLQNYCTSDSATIAKRYKHLHIVEYLKTQGIKPFFERIKCEVPEGGFIKSFEIWIGEPPDDNNDDMCEELCYDKEVPQTISFPLVSNPRNKLCPCSSGKKYKLCCLKKDRNRENQKYLDMIKNNLMNKKDDLVNIYDELYYNR